MLCALVALPPALARLYVVNYVAVAVFAASMYRIVRLWDGSLNRMHFFPLALPFIGVFASMTYLFGFFGISIISGVMEPPFLSSPAPSPKDRSAPPAAGPKHFSPTEEGSSEYSLDNPEVIIVGAGTAGASAAATFARQGRKVLLVERCMSEQDRIVGELLQPGGLRALERLGLDACAKEGTDSVVVDGYAIIRSAAEAEAGGAAAAVPEGQRGSVMLYYPESDPENRSELFGKGVKPAAAAAAAKGGEAGRRPCSREGEVPRGRSFHNCRFVQRLREAAQAEPNVRVVEGTVSALLEGDGGEVVGVRYREAAKGEGQEEERVTREVRAPLTVVADGIWSGLRKCANTNRPQKLSTFVGVLVKHAADAAPVPHKHCGHVVLAHPSPILIYQISSTETRVLVDVAGAMPSAADGGLAAHLREKSAPQLPAMFRPAFLEAVARGDVKSMPNRAMPASSVHRQGALLLGDALNMRHPLTGGGMTVALKVCDGARESYTSPVDNLSFVCVLDSGGRSFAGHVLCCWKEGCWCGLVAFVGCCWDCSVTQQYLDNVLPAVRRKIFAVSGLQYLCTHTHRALANVILSRVISNDFILYTYSEDSYLPLPM